MARWSEGDLQENAGQSGTRMNLPSREPPTWTTLLTRTYGLYRSRFRTFFVIASVPSLIAYMSQFIQRVVAGQLRTRGLLPPQATGRYWALITAVALFEGAVYWTISGFFFAAIASNVLNDDGNDQPVVADAFSMARQRFGPIVAVALLIFALFALGRTVIGFALVSLLERLRLLGNFPVTFAVLTVMLLLVAGLVSRLGLAIPILMDGSKASVSESLRRSVAKTENWEPFFMLFLAKAGILGYAAYWLVNLGLANLWDHGMLSAEAYPWVQSLLYVSIAAMLESPLFIAFSLLYRESQLKPEEAIPAVVG
jgi:hypothetical protein